MSKSRIISNCALCDERALHIIEDESVDSGRSQQCISCGYVTSDRYKLEEGVSMDNHELYSKLTDEMKKWAVVKNNHIWIPTIMTLPAGMIYPMKFKKDMVWSFAPMVDIPEEEQKDYPIPEEDGKFYEKRYDTENVIQFEWFAKALDKATILMKQYIENQSGGLPDLERIQPKA